jgi:hypothetical protein
MSGVEVSWQAAAIELSLEDADTVPALTDSGPQRLRSHASPAAKPPAVRRRNERDCELEFVGCQRPSAFERPCQGRNRRRRLPHALTARAVVRSLDARVADS